MSGQALFWSVHHWSVPYQIMIKTNPRGQCLTLGGVGNGAGVDSRLADSKLGNACDGNGNDCAEMHVDSDVFDVMNALG